MTRESVEEKARRYLAEGRVAVELADPRPFTRPLGGRMRCTGLASLGCVAARPARRRSWVYSVPEDDIVVEDISF